MSCVLPTKIDAPRQPANTYQLPQYYDSNLNRVTNYWNEDPSFLAVASLLKKHKPRSVAELLKAMSENFPKYFESYTLGYDSSSIQEGTYLYPRAIVFGSSGRFIISFNGRSDQKAYESIETMEYDLKNGFQFREITFVPENPQYKISKDDVDVMSSTEDVKVSKPNIGKCLQCHGQNNPRPIWESYFTWPGFYGSNDDLVFRFEPTKPTIPIASLGRHYVTVNGDPERENLIQFIENVKDTHARYKYLGKYINATYKGVGYNIAHPEFSDARPNLKLLDILNRLAQHRLAHVLLQDSKFIPWRYVLTSGLRCGNAFNMRTFDLVPPQMGSRFESELLKVETEIESLQIAADYERQQHMKRLFGRHFAFQPRTDIPAMADDLVRKVIPGISAVEAFNMDQTSPNNPRLAAKAQIILRNLGYDLENYTIGRSRVPMFADGGTDMIGLSIQLAIALEKRFPFEGWDKNLTDRTRCEEIERKSRKLISDSMKL